MQPITEADWQMAVDAAAACLSIESARQFGLIIGGPEVDIERCTQIVAQGIDLGITASPGAAARYVGEWNAEALRVLYGEGTG